MITSRRRTQQWSDPTSTLKAPRAPRQGGQRISESLRPSTSGTRAAPRHTPRLGADIHTPRAHVRVANTCPTRAPCSLSWPACHVNDDGGACPTDLCTRMSLKTQCSCTSSSLQPDCKELDQSALLHVLQHSVLFFVQNVLNLHRFQKCIHSETSYHMTNKI